MFLVLKEMLFKQFYAPLTACNHADTQISVNCDRTRLVFDLAPQELFLFTLINIDAVNVATHFPLCFVIFFSKKLFH